MVWAQDFTGEVKKRTGHERIRWRVRAVRYF